MAYVGAIVVQRTCWRFFWDHVHVQLSVAGRMVGVQDDVQMTKAQRIPKISFTKKKSGFFRGSTLRI
jgi:hypothetical protein